jgi:hypothetical protein
VQLLAAGLDLPPDLPCKLLTDALAGLDSFARENPLDHPADFRLAFRELGLSIGLRAAEKLGEFLKTRGQNNDRAWAEPLLTRKDRRSQRTPGEQLQEYAPLREQIESFWLDRRNRAGQSWTDHREINMVMLATSLAPDGYLTLAEKPE